jgi:photosystem II stability/assembly factor-like uncharacterized protein
MKGLSEWVRKHFILVFAMASIIILGAGVGYVYFTILATKKKAEIKVKRRYFHHNLLAVDHGDEENVWAVGYRGIILHSNDRGKTWKRQHSNTRATLAGVDFINKKEGWVVGQWRTILHTSDGGKHWEKQKIPKDVDPEAYFCDVQFFDEKEGWACGTMAALLHTKDGGKTWEAVDMTDYAEWTTGFNDLYFIDRKEGWLVGETGLCLHTTDGGEEWETVENLGSGKKTLFCVTFLSKERGYISGADGVLVYTRDGGKTWLQPEWKEIPITEHIFKVYFKTSPEFNPASNLGLDVYAAGRGVLIHTYGDLQKNWETILEVYLPHNRHLEYTWFRGMTWPTDHCGIVVGEDGIILRSTDEGRSWRTMTYGYEYEE